MVGRALYWNELVAKWAASREPSTYLVGRPYGSGYNPIEYDDGTGGQDMVPHNHFVHILYRGGLIGLLATLAIFWRTWRGATVQSRRADKPWAPFLFAALPALFAYFIPYWATYESGLLLGIAIGYFGIGRPVTLPVAHTAGAAGFAPSRLPSGFQAIPQYQFRNRLPPELE
jgi:O-antigen ligase